MMSHTIKQQIIKARGYIEFSKSLIQLHTVYENIEYDRTLCKTPLGSTTYHYSAKTSSGEDIELALKFINPEQIEKSTHAVVQLLIRRGINREGSMWDSIEDIHIHIHNELRSNIKLN